MKITGVERQKRGRNFVVRFDDGTSLNATASAISKFGLFTGKELDDKEFKELESELPLHTAKEKAAAMIGARPLSESELKKRLAEKGSTEENALEAVEWLKDLGALDDAEYASAIANRYASKGYGTAKIRDEFYKRGIPRDLWDEALANYVTDSDSIDRFLMLRLKGSTDKKELRKAADALYRRGFSWEEIHEALLKYEETRFPEE